ncbi:MAG: hypothetical protein U9R15_20935 [Chloroflexota bacterium]|nr:hypothetical protein [Chloroflexota bacterium]
MDHIKVLKRAWHTVWNYRALWIFGIILALTTAGGGFNGSGNGGGNYGSNGGNGDFPPFGDFSLPEISSQIVTVLIIAGIVLVCLIIFLSIVATVARYVAETALIRMVDHNEETGEKLGVRQGFRLGWSRTAWRLFLISLLTGLPVALAFVLLLALTVGLAIPSAMAIDADKVVIGVIGIVAAVGLFFLGLFTLIVVGVALKLLRKFFWRACALDALGVIESVRQGFGLVIRRWQDVLVMWLIMVGVRIGWAIALLVVTILLFPVILLLIVVGGLLGGLPALLIWGLTGLFLEGAAPYILAAIVGIPIFALVMAVPGLFLGGLMEVFKSSTWTLTYRELRALEGLEAEELVVLDEPDIE